MEFYEKFVEISKTFIQNDELTQTTLLSKKESELFLNNVLKNRFTDVNNFIEYQSDSELLSILNAIVYTVFPYYDEALSIQSVLSTIQPIDINPMINPVLTILREDRVSFAAPKLTDSKISIKSLDYGIDHELVAHHKNDELTSNLPVSISLGNPEDFLGMSGNAADNKGAVFLTSRFYNKTKNRIETVFKLLSENNEVLVDFLSKMNIEKDSLEELINLATLNTQKMMNSVEHANTLNRSFKSILIPTHDNSFNDEEYTSLTPMLNNIFLINYEKISRRYKFVKKDSIEPSLPMETRFFAIGNDKQNLGTAGNQLGGYLYVLEGLAPNYSKHKSSDYLFTKINQRKSVINANNKVFIDAVKNLIKLASIEYNNDNIHHAKTFHINTMINSLFEECYRISNLTYDLEESVVKRKLRNITSSEMKLIDSRSGEFNKDDKEVIVNKTLTVFNKYKEKLKWNDSLENKLVKIIENNIKRILE